MNEEKKKTIIEALQEIKDKNTVEVGLLYLRDSPGQQPGSIDMNRSMYLKKHKDIDTALALTISYVRGLK